ncbi:hypothetical protein [Streptomyces sp. NPDC060194]|uniref:hypothetical protein n=1 Tax=Streptomyces sp. NPDC060194 TaxID=3347069 RepID=UPI00364F5298
MKQLLALIRPREQRPATPPAHPTPLDEATLRAALATGQAEANTTARCNTCERRSYQAVHADGSRTCWTCYETTAGDQ